MAYDVQAVTEKYGLQTRARVLETPHGRFVVLQTYEQLHGEWTPIHVFNGKESRESSVVTGRLYKENNGTGVFSVTRLEQRDAVVREYLKGVLRAECHDGDISFW